MMHPNETILNDYVDGSLGTVERSGVDQHLAACASCCGRGLATSENGCYVNLPPLMRPIVRDDDADMLQTIPMAAAARCSCSSSMLRPRSES